MWCYFFFQAEDGIRDKLVTGVQTCALPILGVFLARWSLPALLRGTAAIGADVRQAPHLIVWAVLAGCRSEEHTSELQSLAYLVCRLLLEKKKTIPEVPRSAYTQTEPKIRS